MQNANDLLSPEYKAQLQLKHATKPWGGGGSSWIPYIARTIYELKIDKPLILDYGCGRHTLKDAMRWFMPHAMVLEYDPGVPGFEDLPPAPVDLVVCTDVLEHVEENFIPATLDRLRMYTGRAALINIACSPSKSLLPDGRNAHISVFPPDWWLGLLDARWKGGGQIIEQGKKTLTGVWYP